MNHQDVRFCSFLLNDAEWGLARFARPAWLARVTDVAGDLAAVAAGHTTGPRFTALADDLAGADAIYDVCGSETKELALADAAAAVALYAAEGRADDAAKAHIWGWEHFGRDRAAILIAQNAARN
ncbi:hypothetical protein [Mesorhizobium sp. CN2-181]|uniref:hypothetical protein n=1 Tax=Mesorhizobium yinganensis TaxID=3157707 RepID=UPI0032B7CFA8